MKIGGFQKLSLIDFPGIPSAVVFTQGCNFNCPFCHNQALIPANNGDESYPFEDILTYLAKRSNQLGGVVISGGEPTMQPGLVQYLEEVKSRGYAVKLDTNGSMPGILSAILRKRLVDYVAMDIKAPLKKYSLLAGRKVDFSRTEESIGIIRSSGISHEFRTTVVRPYLDKNDILCIASYLNGGSRYTLQACNAGHDGIAADVTNTPQYSTDEIRSLQESISMRQLV